VAAAASAAVAVAVCVLGARLRPLVADVQRLGAAALATSRANYLPAFMLLRLQQQPLLLTLLLLLLPCSLKVLLLLLLLLQLLPLSLLPWLTSEPHVHPTAPQRQLPLAAAAAAAVLRPATAARVK